MAQRAFYRLCDWTPEAGPVEGWLAAWERVGWVPEWPPPYEGVDTHIGPRQVRRFAMVRADTHADSWANQRRRRVLWSRDTWE